MRVIISGGGTGGHLFPALAIAAAIRKVEPSAAILFVGALGRLEMDKVPKAGYQIEGLWISGFQRRLSAENLLFPVKLLSSLGRSLSIIRSFRPDVAVGTGGYASGALLQVAAWLGIPCLIQEQNSYAGITNKILSKRVQKVCIAYEDARRFFPSDKIVMTGNPVREEVLQIANIARADALAYFGLRADLPVLLVIGGSLGARAINNGILACLERLTKAGLQVLWQCGKLYYDDLLKQLGDKNSQIKLFPFIDRMDYAYTVANGIVSRAGAGSIAELSIVGKPTLLMPSPNVAEDHQTANALSLVKQGAVVLVRDSEADALLYDSIMQLFEPTHAAILSQNLQKLAITDAADSIAKEIIHLTKNK